MTSRTQVPGIVAGGQAGQRDTDPRPPPLSGRGLLRHGPEAGKVSSGPTGYRAPPTLFCRACVRNSFRTTVRLSALSGFSSSDGPGRHSGILCGWAIIPSRGYGASPDRVAAAGASCPSLPPGLMPGLPILPPVTVRSQKETERSDVLIFYTLCKPWLNLCHVV